MATCFIFFIEYQAILGILKTDKQLRTGD